MNERIVAELNKRFDTFGNGFTITMKNGKKYTCWEQNDGRYLLDDKTSIWVERTYSKCFNSLPEMAEEIERLA